MLIYVSVVLDLIWFLKKNQNKANSYCNEFSE